MGGLNYKRCIQIGNDIASIIKLPCVRGCEKDLTSGVLLYKFYSYTMIDPSPYYEAEKGDWLCEDQNGRWDIMSDKVYKQKIMKEIDTKTEVAIKLITDGNWKKALSIIRLFRLGFTRKQKRLIEIAADVLNGHDKFYKDLGLDTDKAVSECKAMLLEKYKL